MTRTQCDKFSIASHEKAAAAQDAGFFDDEIVPVDTVEGSRIRADEGIRRGSTVEKLAQLKPAFKPEGGLITAGNSSQISDGSAALLMMTSEKASELGLMPMARIRTAVLVRGHDKVPAADSLCWC